MGSEPRHPVDLRSDTVTRPTEAMRQAMAVAEVGDDVMGEDPTVRALERRIAAMLGHEAALFVPSGTMANQIAVGAHAGPGDELVCTSTSHVYVWEGGGIARLWGVTTRTLEGDRGLAGADHLAGLVRPDDAHYPRTRLVCLENTHNRGGGRVHPVESVAEVGAWARSHGLAFHLDGARLFNAAVAAGRPASDWSRLFDSVAVCFSKGLGAPVGSAVVGTEGFIRKAHRLRKVLGGGMRQAGLLAAAALHALDHHVERMADDHADAQVLADAVRRADGLTLEFDPVETNLVWFTIDPERGTAAEFASRLKERGVLVSALGPQNLRACTHLDVGRERAEFAAEMIAAVAGG